MITRAILFGISLFIVFCLGIAILVALSGRRAVPVTDPAQQTIIALQATNVALQSRTVNAAEAQATQAANTARVTTSSDPVRGGLSRDQAAQVLGVDPQYLTQNPRDDNGWDFSPPSPAKVTVPQGWRADYTDANYGIHSCSDVYEPGVYGPADITAVAATLWFVPGETACPPWSTNAQFGGKADQRFQQSGSGSNAAPSSNNAAPATAPTVAPATSNQPPAQPAPNAPANAEAWQAQVAQYGNVVSGPDKFGGIVIDVTSASPLSDAYMAIGEGKKIEEHGGDRTLSPGRWTVYPPYAWRSQLGFAS